MKGATTSEYRRDLWVTYEIDFPNVVKMLRENPANQANTRKELGRLMRRLRRPVDPRNRYDITRIMQRLPRGIYNDMVRNGLSEYMAAENGTVMEPDAEPRQVLEVFVLQVR